MTKMNMIEIPVKDIKPNLSQPREHFDKEKLQELASSILSNGLINPIIVRKSSKNDFTIVAGERRWQAHKIAGLKTIQAMVKEYKNDEEWMIESLIENIHREDLHPVEKARYYARIMKLRKCSRTEFAKMVNISLDTVSSQLSLLEDKEITKLVEDGKLPSSQAQTILNMADKNLANKLAKKVAKNEMGRNELRETVKAMRVAPVDVREALLSDEISVEQAHKISRLKDAGQRTKAIREHKAIKTIDKQIEESIVRADKHKESRGDMIQLVKVNKWIKSFRYSVTNSAQQLGKTFKILGDCIKFVSLADDKQKEELEEQLDRFSELLERGEQLTEQIKSKL